MGTIPVIVDDVKTYPDFEMTRCTYFTIESDTPSPDWILGLGNLDIPFYLLGLSGIIWKPVKGDFFDNPDLIEKLFNAIEEGPGLYIDVNDIWLPNYLFYSSKSKRGDVYRIGEELFNKAYLYREDRISKEEFLMFCEKLEEELYFSEKEAYSFRRWGKDQIAMAKQIYPKNRELELKWHGNNE